MRTLSFLSQTLMVAFVGTALVITGCSSAPQIAKNAKGAVYLEEVTDWSFQANHPAVIDQLTIMKIVKGVYSDENGNGSSGMSAGGSKPMRVFSDEDAEFLAPLLAQGLAKAQPEQLVGFRVSSSAGSGSEPTAGSIYVQQDAIHFTISKGAGSTIFLPETASRTEHAPPFAAGGMAGVTAHVIDYHALANAPMPAAMPVVRASSQTAVAPEISATEQTVPQQETHAMTTLASGHTIQSTGDNQKTEIQEMLAKKDNEIELLRKESEWMKRTLRAREEEIKALKATVKKASAKKAVTKKRAAAQQAR
ncbi:hypothetical protein [Petrachloros mirabilis]